MYFVIGVSGNSDQGPRPGTSDHWTARDRKQTPGGGKQGGGPPQPGFAAKDFSKIPGFDPEIQTVKNDAGGKGICKQYQVGKCAFGAKCRWAHVCDVMMEGNQACGASHTRQGHFAATGNKGKGRGSGPPPPPAEQETG